MKKPFSLFYIRELIDSAKALKEEGFDVEALMSSITEFLDIWKREMESKSITMMPIDITLRRAFYFILLEDEWVPVCAGEETTQGRLAWTINYTDGRPSETGTSRIGQWAFVDAGGDPNIEIDIEAISEIQVAHLK